MMEGTTAETEGAAPPAETRRRSTLPIIFLTLFLDLAGFSIIFPLSPSLLEHYLVLEGRGGLLGGVVTAIQSTSPLAAENPIYAAALFGGILGSLYSLLQFLFAPFWGSLSDRVGRKPVLLATVGGLAGSYLLWALSGSFPLFILSRLLAGAMGGNLSVATAAAADVTDAKDRAKAMGIVGAAFGLGFILGPAIGGGLSHIDLSTLFPALARYGVNPFTAAALGACLLSLGNVVWIARRFPETLPPERRRPASPHLPNPFAGFARSESAGLRRTNIFWFVYLIAFSGMEFTLTFLADERFGFTPRKNALLFLFVGTILVIVQAGIVRRLAPRIGERRLAAIGLGLAIPGFALIGLAGHPLVLVAGVGLMGVGTGFAQPSITALASLYAPADRQGTALGAFRSLGSFSRILGPIAATAVFWSMGSASPYLCGAAILILPAILVLRLPDPRAPTRPGRGN